MLIKEIQARAGSLVDYLWYVFLVFGWYFLDNVYTANQPLFPGSWIESLAGWVVRFLLYPILLAGIFGGIHAQQQTLENWDLSGFFASLGKHALRLLGANLLLYVLIIALTVSLLAAGFIHRPDFADNQPLLALINIPYSAVSLFWFAALVVERKFLPSLFLAIKTLATTPLALLIGLAWGGLVFAETFFFDYQTTPIPLAVNGLRAGVMAAARILAVVYALAVYKQARGISPQEPEAESLAPDETRSAAGETVVNAGFGFGLASFLPLLHLVALALGLVAILKQKRIGLRSVLACSLGGFFTLFYALVLLSWLIRGAVAAPQPGYAFLAAADPALRSQAALLEQGSFQEALVQLEQSAAGQTTRTWAFETALALARYQTGDSRGAFEAFVSAAQQQPERSEFYYYYGLALLENDREAGAAEQFQLAVAHEPKLVQAESYQTLLKTKYSPPEGITSLLFLIFLLVSFAFHEYGHAFVAWKLGDDTAERQGRLTLNPLQHLDLFGSLILPGLMLLQSSGMVFGWARPVPVDPRNFRDPRRDHMRVAFAGPAVNLLVALVLFFLLALIMIVVRLFWPETISINLAEPYAAVSIVGPGFARWLTVSVAFIKQALYFSLVLGCLNLLPIPPLDGSWILSGLFPNSFGVFFEKIRGFSFLLFMALAMTPILGYILTIPLGLVWAGLQVLFAALGFG